MWSIKCFVSVVPSFSILVEPEANYISYGLFNRFNFKVSARWINMLTSCSELIPWFFSCELDHTCLFLRYLHGAPVANGEVYLRYGYISGKNPPVLIPSSVSRDRVRNMNTDTDQTMTRRSRIISRRWLHTTFSHTNLFTVSFLPKY